MQKTHLSRSMTRAMGMELPIGDPFGGPAYGEKNDPVSAFISLASMAGTYAAAGSFAAMTLMQGLTFAGAALSLVGNVTGNRTLSKIGLVAGLAGGVGMLAESAGIFSSGTVGETFGLGEAAGNASLSQSVAPGAQATAPGAQNTTPLADVARSQMADSATNLTSSQVPNASLAGKGINVPGSATSALNASPVDLYSLAGPGPGAGAGIQTGPGAGLNLSAAGRAAGPGFMESLKAGNFMDAASAAGSNLMDLAKTNPGAAYMLGQTASGIANWLSGKTDAEIAALEAQSSAMGARGEQIRFEIEREKQRRANLNAGWAGPNAVNTSIPVNPNPGIQQPWQQQQQPGLIAGNMPPRG